MRGVLRHVRPSARLSGGAEHPQHSVRVVADEPGQGVEVRLGASLAVGVRSGLLDGLDRGLPVVVLLVVQMYQHALLPCSGRRRRRHALVGRRCRWAPRTSCPTRATVATGRAWLSNEASSRKRRRSAQQAAPPAGRFGPSVGDPRALHGTGRCHRQTNLGRRVRERQHLWTMRVLAPRSRGLRSVPPAGAPPTSCRCPSVSAAAAWIRTGPAHAQPTHCARCSTRPCATTRVRISGSCVTGEPRRVLSSLHGAVCFLALSAVGGERTHRPPSVAAGPALQAEQGAHVRHGVPFVGH